MNSLLQQISNLFSDPKKLKIMFSAMILIAVVGLVASVYLVYQEQQEKALSLIVNEKVTAKNQVLEQWSEGEISGEEYTNQLTTLGNDLYRLYQEAPSTMNGVRALITSAQIDIQLGNPAVEEKLQIASVDGEELAPLALYLLSQVYENQEDYTKALDTLKGFREQYVLHYLKPLAMMSEARIYRLMGQVDQAVGIYSEILQNQEFSLFFDKAEEEISLMELARREAGSDSIDTTIDPGFGSGFVPDYLQTNIGN